MAAFSRLQLAAALLEYDNDPSNPEAPYRSAHESAIFTPLRRNRETRSHVASRKSNYLGVALPSETGSLGGRESALDSRRSRGSTIGFRNPFGVDEEEEGEEDGLEVDLASWGLDAFMVKDKSSKNNNIKTKQDFLPNPHPIRTNEALHKRTSAARAMSMDNFDQFSFAGAFSESGPSSDPSTNRRRSTGSPLDLADVEPSQEFFPPRRASFNTLREAIHPSAPLHSIPFPTSSVPSPSTLLHEDDGSMSNKNPKSGSQVHSHERTYSTASIDSKMLLIGETIDRLNHTHTSSSATMGVTMLSEDNPFALRPPSNASRFDPKAAAHARTLSNASMGSRMPLDDDAASAMTGKRARDRPYSTLELLRPKVLVMPSPLQPSFHPVISPPIKTGKGFQLSVDGPPLPPGARSTRRSLTNSYINEPILSPPAPIASNTFIPNPRTDLSLSQLTFRNTLMVGGRRDVAYADIDALPRATEEGEQAQYEPQMEREVAPVPIPVIVEDTAKPGRPAGKLYGKSLIDDLEEKKTQMRKKQRVFTGDQRPSMMARDLVQRSSTLIDPATLLVRPQSQHVSSYDSQNSQVFGGKNSANIKPLLHFDNDNSTVRPKLPLDPKVTSTRSVFGVDTIWEREMVKLREIEAQEKIEAEGRRTKELFENTAQEKKAKRKGKGEAKQLTVENAIDWESLPEPKVSAEPPVLPGLLNAVKGPRPQVIDDGSESDEGVDVKITPAYHNDKRRVTSSWPAGSSDEEDNVLQRKTGTGPRYSNPGHHRSSKADNVDSEEDLPLAVTVSRVIHRATILGHLQGYSDDEEKPLSVFVDKTKSSLPSINFDPLSISRGETDDDDRPLGLRVSRNVPNSQMLNQTGGGEEDDMPLAFHPQQRRTQYQMMAQHAQQQQMIMQAHMQSSIFFGGPPGMMGSGFFGPMAAPVMLHPSLPPARDAAKYGRVDQWRHDVAVEGET